jgi:hypothetical protein
MNLQGEQIPKATMTSYLKEKLGKTKISTEFTEGILHIAKGNTRPLFRVCHASREQGQRDLHCLKEEDDKPRPSVQVG